TTRPPTAIVVGGPGWDRRRLPSRVNVAPALGAGLDLVEQALGR
ncbi:MAG: hypothetical protein QOE84_3237, partial [Actinomycetota bacterium]|nr:hypothetical protein [Actinomycetota bacterium]